MKSPLCTLSAIVLAIVSCAPALCGQSVETHLRMQVPFPFQYGSERFAAGSCEMTLPQTNILQLRCGSHSAMAMVEDEDASRTIRAGHALFRKYGYRYLLEEIWVPGGTTRLTVYDSKWKKQASRELRAANPAPSVVELALLDTVPSRKR